MCPVTKSRARELIIVNHYSHKWSSCRYALGLYNKTGVICGVAIYGYPVGRRVVTSISPIVKPDEVLELTRLWLRDEEPHNTESYFLGCTFNWLRIHTNIRVLISYSDPMYGHLGIIYQATNWWYQGNATMLVKGYYHVVLGEQLHPRTCVAKHGSVKASILTQIDPDYHRIEMPHKHRYLYVLHKKDRKFISSTLKHPILPYPKGEDYVREPNRRGFS